MKEDFLHYVWKYQKFNKTGLITTSGESIDVLKAGTHNQNSGPDFFNAQLNIGKQLWAGNLEIHLKASDWYLHNHEIDMAYDNVILHVVWEYDMDVFRADGTAIPVLVIKDKIGTQVIQSYNLLFSKTQNWIPCENEISRVKSFERENWLERLFIERLEDKVRSIIREQEKLSNNWEALLFNLLVKNFGLKVNGESFFNLAQGLDFKTVQKCSRHWLELEALFFGQLSLLDKFVEDSYFIQLKEHYNYLQLKFGLENKNPIKPQFFRLRPANFPTIRLSQLAVLYGTKKQLFSEVISVKNIKDCYELFAISASEYWDTHHNFGLISPKRKKRLSKRFVDLLVINTIIPLKFSFARYEGREITEELIELAGSIKSEENAILKKFKDIGFGANNSLQSQGLLQLKKEYCDQSRCLDCAIGNAILKPEG